MRLQRLRQAPSVDDTHRSPPLNTNKELEEALVNMREVLPRGWWAVYAGCVQAGFTPNQAFGLTTTYILASHSTIRPDNPSSPNPDQGE